MAGTPVPQDAGRHRLGPHVVGVRVVVRRLLRGETGPTGGPALTDVLGTCLSWQDGTCVVQPEDGEPVRIAIADIVSGKPVPPRPSPRLRIEPAAAQRRALALWPDLETRPLGDWLLRHSPTSRARRARSVLAFGPSGVPDGVDDVDVVDEVVAFYAATTGRPIAAVLPGSAEEELFGSRGWGPESADADTLFQVAGVARARRVVSRLVTSRLASSHLSTSAGAPRTSATAVTLEEHGDLVTARIGDRASGVAAYAEDWVGLRGVQVDPAHRREGLALAVVAQLLEWGAERGATTAYLQVLADNAPALALYEELGFTTHHTYRYVSPP